MPIPTVQEVIDFGTDIDDAESIVNGSTTVTTRLGGDIDSLKQQLAKVGLVSVAAYNASTTYTDFDVGVEESGIVYRPLPSALPIGPEAFDSANWIVVQGFTKADKIHPPVASYADLRGLTSSTITDGTVITVTDDGIAGPGVVKTGTVTQVVGIREPFTDDSNRYWERSYSGAVNLLWTGALGDDSTVNTTAISGWLDYLISSNSIGLIPDGVFLSGELDKAANNGIRIVGSGTLKGTGSTALRFIRFTGVRGYTEIDGVTIDGNNIFARPLEIQNSGGSGRPDVMLGKGLSVINAKNTAPDTNTATGILVRGRFSKVTFAGEVDGVDSTSTSGAVSEGFAAIHFDADDDYIRETIIDSTARIKNVTNSNTTTADADGVKLQANNGSTYADHLQASLVVSPGAYFENCKGRAIKSQVFNNTISGAVIKRDLYDGITEINLQYAGGVVRDNIIIHDGFTAEKVIGITVRDTPFAKPSVVEANELYVTGSPATPVEGMILVNATNDTAHMKGFVIQNNKAYGTPDYMVQLTCGNVINTNHVSVNNNWASAVGTSFLQVGRYNSGRGQVHLTFNNNRCDASCTGATLDVADVCIQSEDSNFNISKVFNLNYGITSGAITPYSRDIRINTESSAASDDLDTINLTDSIKTGVLVLRAQDNSRTVNVKDGTGNIQLAGGDFALNNLQDRLVLEYDNNNSYFVELSRSDNGT